MPATAGSDRRRFYAALAGLAAAAATLAVCSRLPHTLAGDEPFMANSVRLPWQALVGIFAVDNVPFAYVLLRGWTAVFGEAEWALRSLSVVAYAVAVVVAGLAGRRAAGAAGGLVAATLLATSARLGIVHAATARPYALLALLAATAMLQSLRMLQPDTGGLRRAWGLAWLALVHLLGLFTHPTYVFVLVAYAAASWLVYRARATGVVVAGGAAAVAYAVIWGRMLLVTVAAGATSWMTTPRLADVRDAALLLWGTGPGFLLLGAILALALSRPDRIRAAVEATPVRWAGVAVAIAWGLPLAVSFWKPVFLASRTPVMLLPVTAVLIAGLLAHLAERRALAALAAILLVAGAQVVPAARGPDPMPTRDSLRIVLGRAPCGDTIVASGLARDAIDYYGRRLGAPACLRIAHFPSEILDWPRRVSRPSEVARIEREAQEVAATAARRGGTVWAFGLSRGMGAEATAILEAALQRSLSCGERLAVRGASFDAVLVCAPRPERAASGR